LLTWESVSPETLVQCITPTLYLIRYLCFT